MPTLDRRRRVCANETVPYDVKKKDQALINKAATDFLRRRGLIMGWRKRKY